MQEEFDVRLDAIAEAIEMGLADEAAEVLAQSASEAGLRSAPKTASRR